MQCDFLLHALICVSSAMAKMVLVSVDTETTTGTTKARVDGDDYENIEIGGKTKINIRGDCKGEKTGYCRGRVTRWTYYKTYNECYAFFGCEGNGFDSKEECEEQCVPGFCKTVSGAKPNRPCQFPFIFAGKEHTSCIYGRFPSPWCSTNTTHKGVHLRGNWGNCDERSCPIKEDKDLECPTVVVKGANYANCNGVYTVTSELRVTNLPIYENRNIGNRYMFYLHGYGWSIGPKRGIGGGYYHFSGVPGNKEPWEQQWRDKRINVTCG